MPGRAIGHSIRDRSEAWNIVCEEQRREKQPAKRTATIDWDYLATFDIKQADAAIEYIKTHAKSDKPFFVDVNFMKMHNPNNPAPQFRGKTHLGNYSDAMLELDYNIGRVMDAIRAEAPDTIVIVTADNGAWQDAWPDAGTTPFRGMKGTGFEGGWRVPALMWWPGKIPAGANYDELMSHIDCWATLGTMVGLKAPPKGEMMYNNGKPIYFDSIDNSAYVLGKEAHSAAAGGVELVVISTCTPTRVYSIIGPADWAEADGITCGVPCASTHATWSNVLGATAMNSRHSSTTSSGPPRAQAASARTTSIGTREPTHPTGAAT